MTTRLTDTDFLEAMQLVKGGLDYAWLDHRLVSNMVEHLKDPAQIGQLIEAMIEHGFNPLQACEAEMPKLCAEPLLEPIERALAEREAMGRPLRDAQGGNLYHAIARHRYTDLETVLARLAEDLSRPDKEHTSGSVDGRLSWIHAQDENGNTPLHVLWSDEVVGQAGRQLVQIYGTLAKAANFANRRGLMTTGLMMDLGADLITPNHQGVEVIDLLVHTNADTLNPIDKKILDRIIAITQNSQLLRDTPGAGGRTRPGPRL